MLFPPLFRWHNIVIWQSRPESPWLAFVVTLHVGSAIGLLIYFWRDWIRLIRAFFATLAKRRIETSSERLIWLIIIATIPVGILGLAFEHPLRTLFAKPISAVILLMVDGVVLIAAERLRRRASVRGLALTEGLNPDGARDLDTLEFREAGVIGVAQSAALIAGISRDGVVMSSGLARGLDNADAARFAFLLATPPILAAGIVKFGDLLHPSPLDPPDPPAPGRGDHRRRSRRGHRGDHRPLPHQVLRAPQPDPVRALLPRVRGVHDRVHLHRRNAVNRGARRG